MKKTFVLVFILLIIKLNTYSQISFVTIASGELPLTSKPRLSIDIGIPFTIVGPYAPIVNNSIFIESGLFVTNNGFIYEKGDYKYIHRTLGLSIPIRIGKIMKEKYYLGVGHQFNFPFHYKLKRFDAGTRKNKEIITKEFFSKRVSKYQPCLEVSFGIMYHKYGRFSIRAKLFYTDFFNVDYSETVNDLEVKPYESIAISQHFGITFSYSPGL